MNKESKLNLNASNYAISHCDSGKTYNGLEVHKMLCDAYIAGNNDNDKDEKIRKALINVFATHKDYEMFFGVSVKDILAWLENQNHDGINEVLENPQKYGLEKQGGQKPMDEAEPKFHIGDKIRIFMKGTVNEKSLTITKIDEKGYWSEDLFICNFNDADRLKLVEQKLFDYENCNIQQHDFAPKSAMEAIKEEKVDNANKAKPMFHKGDWVVCEVTGLVYQIKDCIESLNNHKYGYDLTTNGGYIGSDEVNYYHLWSIEDAKCGDVLTNKNGSIFIFKEEYMAGKPTAYCGLVDGVIHVGDGCCWANEKCYPATKEQCNLLFSKMKETGWSWNPETKELSQSRVTKISDKDRIATDIAINELNHNTVNDSYCKENCKGYQETGKCYADLDCEAKRKADVVKPIFKVGDEVYNKFDKSLAHVIIEYVDEATYYGDTTNFDIIDQDQWGIVRSCENCKCGHYDYPTVSCYLHEDCGGDEPIIIHDDDFVETAMNCKEFEQEN